MQPRSSSPRDRVRQLHQSIGTPTPLEIYRRATPPRDPDMGGEPWDAALLVLLLTVLGLITLGSAPQTIQALEMQARSTVVELGVPTQWRF